MYLDCIVAKRFTVLLCLGLAVMCASAREPRQAMRWPLSRCARDRVAIRQRLELLPALVQPACG